MMSKWAIISIDHCIASSPDRRCTMKILKYLFALLTISVSEAFLPALPSAKSRAARFRVYFASSSSEEQNNDVLEKQKTQLTATLEKIDALKESIEEEDGAVDIRSVEESIAQLESKVSQLSSAVLPPAGLSSSDFANAIRLFIRLPFKTRLAFCEALDISDSFQAALDWNRVPEIVSKMYEERCSLTPQRLQDAVKKADSITRARAVSKSAKGISDSTKHRQTGATSNNIMSIFNDNNMDTVDTRNEEMEQPLLGRVTRKEGRVATEEDLKTLVAVLDKDNFVASDSEAIAGGYVIRGRNVKKTGAELIEALDSRLPAEWDSQVSFLPDFTLRSLVVDFSENENESENVLLLLKKDMSPTTSRWLLLLSTALAVFSALLFAVGVYGGNDLVTSRLTEQDITGAFTGLDWFNGKVLDILLPLFFIQGLHELASFGIAFSSGIKTTAPTLLPLWGLPFAGAKTSIKESPKNLTSLFDFAFVGPLVGIIASLAFLFAGLQATASANAEMLQYLPALPVSVIKLSTLGGTILDNFYGGNGYITLQDPRTAIPLHPSAIAGFCGLVINSIDLLPLGATDGGRLSLALFGRQGHQAVGGATWLALLISTLVLERPDVLLGAWAVYNIVETDPEVPCRDEVDDINLPRAALALAMWFVALFTLAPLA